jgi:hypothetical protein
MKTKLALSAFAAAFVLSACGSKTEAPATPAADQSATSQAAGAVSDAASSAAEAASSAAGAANAAAEAASSAAGAASAVGSAMKP